MNSQTNPTRPFFVRDKLALIVSGSLLSLAACAWAATYYVMSYMTMVSPQSRMTLKSSFAIAAIVSSPSSVSISIFEGIWIIGMVAMMFPAMIPIVLLYNRIVAKLESNTGLARSLGTPLFLGGYLIVYSALGICAFAAIYFVIRFSLQISELALFGGIVSGAILIATGIYQFTSLKSRCLNSCISPIGFFTIHYKSGLAGSLRMGVTHGYYCVGCCWAFMLVMLGVGAMSIPIMAVLGGLIAVEKILARGVVRFHRSIGLGFIILGAAVMIFPGVLAYF